jgi:hypothetical protein
MTHGSVSCSGNIGALSPSHSLPRYPSLSNRRKALRIRRIVRGWDHTVGLEEPRWFAAFARAAEEPERKRRDRRNGVVRVARQQPGGGRVQKRRPRKRTRRPIVEATPDARHGRSPTDTLIADPHRSIDALAKHAQKLEADMRELRANGEQIEKLCRALT